MLLPGWRRGARSDLAGMIHPLAGDAVSIVVIYTTIAARDLARHSMAVFRPLAAGDLAEARRRVGAIVGRDTERLDEAGVVRAAVESVAESTVDGVTAPLFFAVIAGPVGAMVYRAINTLDSMFGHQDERYRRVRLGRGADRRPGQLLPGPADGPAGLSGGRAAAVSGRPMRCGSCVRDGRKHASPNSGLTEAAMAGALGVQLGGVELLRRPAAARSRPSATRSTPLSPRHILLANALMFADRRPVSGRCAGRSRRGRCNVWHAWRTAGMNADAANSDLHRRRQGQDHGRAGHGLPRQRPRHADLRDPVHQGRRDGRRGGRRGALPPTSRSIRPAWASFRRPTIRGSPSIARRPQAGLAAGGRGDRRRAVTRW